MSKFSRKNILVLGLCLSMFFGLSSAVKSDANKDNKKVETKVDSKITDFEKKMINTILLEEPLFTISLMKTFRKSKEISDKYKDTKVLSAKDLATEKDALINPVKGFLANLHSNKFITGPLFIRVLFGDDKLVTVQGLNKTSNKVSIDDVVKLLPAKDLPVAIKFLSVPSSEAEGFFDTEINCVENLLKACNEFNVLFGAVNDILSPEVKAAAVAKFKELAAKK